MDGFNTGSGTECLLTISGGTLKVNASGDGLDSNGNLIIEGGEIYVSGPTNGETARSTTVTTPRHGSQEER